MKRKITVGTRTSRLAMWQTQHVVAQLQQAWPGLECLLTDFITVGDKTLDKPLPDIGGKGLFTAELERALLAGEIDIAVHSLKDLPVEDASGLTLGAVAGRADVRDCLIARDGWTLERLPKGAVVGTSSVRRKCQLLAARPDLIIRSIRGNVETRLRKVREGDYDATILAAAGIIRLDLSANVAEWLSPDIMLPAPGQGALAVQCRADDAETLDLLAVVDDIEARHTTSAERAFLQRLGGGCAAPIAAFARVKLDRAGNSQFQMDALVGATDGSELLRVSGSGDDPLALATDLSEKVLRQGAGFLLEALVLPGGLRARFTMPLSGRFTSDTAGTMPLAGRRIVVTRAAEQAAEFSQLLRAQGAIPLEIHSIGVEPLDDMAQLDRAIDSICDYGWVIFTSANAVRFFWDRLLGRGLDALTLAQTKIAAVGSATAGALQTRGLTVEFYPERFAGVEIAAGLLELDGVKVLLPRAERAGRDLVEELRLGGAIVDDIPIYRTVPIDIEDNALALLIGGVDAVTFASGSAARSFIGAAIAHGVAEELWAESCIACIGPVTAKAVTELGINVDIVAKKQTIEGLITALATYYSEERR